MHELFDLLSDSYPTLPLRDVPQVVDENTVGAPLVMGSSTAEVELILIRA